MRGLSTIRQPISPNTNGLRRLPVPLEYWAGLGLAVAISFYIGMMCADWMRVDPIPIPAEWAVASLPPPPKANTQRTPPPQAPDAFWMDDADDA